VTWAASVWRRGRPRIVTVSDDDTQLSYGNGKRAGQAVPSDSLAGCCEGRPFPAPRTSALELDRGLGHQLTLVTRDIQFLGGRLARAVAAGDGRGTVGRAAVGFGNIEEFADTVAGGHDDHSVVGQGGPGGGNGHFLAAASAGGGEHAGDLAVQQALGPEASGLVEEV